MANPQKENGYTPISNELLEAIYNTQLNATQLKIIMVICRYTYGFNRKEHSLSESFISKAINISKRYVSLELNNLIDKKIITVMKPHTDTTPNILLFNKHYDEWYGRTILPQVNNTSTGEQLINTTVEEQFHPPVEQYFHQDKQYIKQNLKQKSAFEKSIDDFIEFRKKIKSPMTERAVELMVDKINKLAADDETKIEIINQSIVNGWKGIFPINISKNDKTDQESSNTASSSKYQQSNYKREDDTINEF